MREAKLFGQSSPAVTHLAEIAPAQAGGWPATVRAAALAPGWWPPDCRLRPAGHKRAGSGAVEPPTADLSPCWERGENDGEMKKRLSDITGLVWAEDSRVFCSPYLCLQF